MTRFLYILATFVLLASCAGGNKEEGDRAATTAPPADTQVVTPQIVTVPDTAKAPARAPGSISINEQHGLDEILHFYGGKCTWKIGDTKDKKQFFRIEVSNSGSLDSNRQITELSAANIAALFYKELREERGMYKEVQTVIIFNDGKRLVKTYPVSSLEIVVSKMMVTMRITALLKQKKFDDIAPLLNDKSDIMPYNKEALLQKVKNAEGTMAPIKEFVPYGFMFAKAKNGKPVLHISGILVREGQNNEFSVDFDPASVKDEALFFNYKL